MGIYGLLLGILCVWRITHLFNAEDGPGGWLIKWRQAMGNGWWGDLLDCFYCLSLLIALPFAVWLGETLKEQVLLWPALSGGAILIERLTSGSPAPYIEDRRNHE